VVAESQCRTTSGPDPNTARQSRFFSEEVAILDGVIVPGQPGRDCRRTMSVERQYVLSVSSDGRMPCAAFVSEVDIGYEFRISPDIDAERAC
jgi:hypothetical protein